MFSGDRSRRFISAWLHSGGALQYHNIRSLLTRKGGTALPDLSLASSLGSGNVSALSVLDESWRNGEHRTSINRHAACFPSNKSVMCVREDRPMGLLREKKMYQEPRVSLRGSFAGKQGHQHGLPQQRQGRATSLEGFYRTPFLNLNSLDSRALENILSSNTTVCRLRYQTRLQLLFRGSLLLH